MRKTLLIITALLFITSTVIPQSKVNINNLVQYGDKMYKTDDDRPYTGRVFDLYKSNGNKKVKGYYKDGFRHGDWSYYTEIGDGKYEVEYTAGLYNVAVFTDNLGTDYTGSPITGETKQDITYLFQREDKYDFSKYPMIFGTIKDGEPDGLTTNWYENGQKSSEVTYKDDNKDGKWTEWYSNGQKKDEGTFKGSIKDGKWIGWNENGTMRYEGNFKDGKKHGQYKDYYEDGEYIRSGVSKNKIGDIHTITDYIDNKIHGSFLKFHEGQLVIEEKYKQGLSEKGIWYHSNGQKLGVYNYKDEEYDGLQTEWYENGQKQKEFIYKDGKKDGKWTKWYENGQKQSEKYYKKNLLHGSLKTYNKKDEVTYHVVFIDDIPEILVFGDFYRPETYPKWETSIDKSLIYLRDFLNDGLINEEEYISFRTDLLKDEKYWNEEKASVSDNKTISVSELFGEQADTVYVDKTEISIEDEPRVKFIPYDVPPKPLTPIRPKYPEIAQEAGIEGTVIVQVFVDKKGRVKETSILKGIPNTGLDEAAIAAIRETRFEPGKQRERPVGVWISIPVNFRLK